jgi:hypothetical protein
MRSETAVVAISATVGIGALAAWLTLRIRHARNIAALQAELERARAAQPEMSRIRHDVRGALSPALLVTDRLLSSDDAAVRRSGEIILRAIERANDILNETRPTSPPIRVASAEGSDVNTPTAT